MIACKCIEKIRDKSNKIVEYKLIDGNNNTTNIKPHELKLAIKSNNIIVTNLKLTKDDKLIDINNKNTKKQSSNTSKAIKNKEVRSEQSYIQSNKNIPVVKDLIKYSMSTKVFNEPLKLARNGKKITLEQLLSIMEGFSDNPNEFENANECQIYKLNERFFLYLGYYRIYRNGGCTVDEFKPEKIYDDWGHLLIPLDTLYKAGYALKAGTNNILDLGIGEIIEHVVEGVGTSQSLEKDYERHTDIKLTNLKTLYTPSKIKRIQYIMYGNSYNEQDGGLGLPRNYKHTTLFTNVYDIVKKSV